MNYMQGMKQDHADAHEDVFHRSALMPCQPLRCHPFLWFATNLLQLEQVIIPKTTGEMVKVATQAPPESRGENIAYWAPVTILLDSILDIKQHKEGSNDSSQWCLSTCRPTKSWSRNYNPFTTLISLPLLDYSEDKVIIAPWKAFQIIWRDVPRTGFVSTTASSSCAIETIYKNNQTNYLIPMHCTHKTKYQYGKQDVKIGWQGNMQQCLSESSLQEDGNKE